MAGSGTRRRLVAVLGIAVLAVIAVIVVIRGGGDDSGGSQAAALPMKWPVVWTPTLWPPP